MMPARRWFFDFDGTLSKIVLDPTEACLVPGASEVLLEAIKGDIAVAIVSGRPLEFLGGVIDEDLFSKLWVAGSYGVEVKLPGQPPHDYATAVSSDAISGFLALKLNPEVAVEWKPYSFTLHYRNAPWRRTSVEALSEELVGRFGVTPLASKAAVEFFYNGLPSKGEIVRRWSDGATEMLYAGDDVSDLDAFDVLNLLRNDGVSTCCVAVVSNEVPLELESRADVVVEGPIGLLSWVRARLREGL